MTTTSPKKKQDHHFIGNFDQAPEFSKQNNLIGKGYRINFNTPKKIFKSLFMVHNQTMNIWTHLFAAVIVICVLGYFVWSNTSEISKEKIKIQLQSKIDEYINKLNLVDIADTTNSKLIEISQSLKLKYQQFSKITQERIQVANQSISKIMVDLEKLFDESLIKFIEAKENFENKGIQEIMDSVDRFGDNQTYFHSLKISIKDLSNLIISKIDSPIYDFIDLTDSSNDGHISRWPVVAMMISAITCLLCSAIFHLFYPMSIDYKMVFARFDYAGINILISGSVIPPLYYGLYCHPALAKFYIVCIAIIAVTLFTASLFQFMHTPKFRTFKSICYGSFGIIVSVPLFHMLINQIFFPNGDKFTFINSIPLFLALGASYLGGLVVYTKRCPERQKPGHYDICGHSHQIWHMAVIMGIFFTYLAALQNFDERKRYPTCPI